MSLVSAYSVPAPGAPLTRTTIERRDLRDHDIDIDIRYSGVCHSDLSQAREEWFTSIFPMVPGHEIAGVVRATGPAVTRFKPGDKVGVGCYVDSCRTCVNCQSRLPNYCQTHLSMTYNGREADRQTPTLGGYSSSIVVDENYAVSIPETIPLHEAAPLMCAGITVFQPLSEWNVGPGTRVGVIGLGGLGHMAIKLAKLLGANVTLVSRSPEKEANARALGADHFVLSTQSEDMAQMHESLDLIISTASGTTDLDPYMPLLGTDGTFVNTGLPDAPLTVSAFHLTRRRRRIAGVSNGSIDMTQEMLDLCGAEGIGSDVEVMDIAEVNEAWRRLDIGDVKYRFVLDTASLDGSN